MPIRKVKGGYKIKRGSKKGYYPKKYRSKAAARRRVKQMDKFRHARRKGWRPTGRRRRRKRKRRRRRKRRR